MKTTNGKWLQITKNARSTNLGLPTMVIPTGKNNVGKSVSIIRLNTSAMKLLKIRQINIYVDKTTKQIAIEPTLDKESFVINKTSRSFSSSGLLDQIDLKNLPKKLVGKWDENFKALIFDYSKCAEKSTNIFDS